MAITTDTTPLAQDYSIFEATSIKQFLIEQLNAGGIFTDQKYLGSNLNAVIDILATILQQIQFHYNTTATESTFATASLYENMNKLASLLNYKPTGQQTSILPITITNLLGLNNISDTFVIPRYSYIVYNKPFVLKNDLTFTSKAGVSSNIEDILYQGTLTESEIFSTTGENFQTITLVDKYHNTNSGKFISDNFFDVYVKEPNGRWTQYSEVDLLFESSGGDKVYEKRINEYYNYEFKFGNNINGYRPVANSEVIIFHIVSDGTSAQVGDGIIKNSPIYQYNSVKYNEIIKDVSTGIFEIIPNFISAENLKLLTISNIGASTDITAVENPDITREMLPKLFAAQNRLITSSDYSTFIKKNFSNFVLDNYVFNNNEYTAKYLRYFYNIGLGKPNDNPRVLLNQVNFQTSCGFNNVYIALLPKVNTIIDSKIPNYISTSLKRLIVDSLEQHKDMTHNIAPIDPIYKAISFGVFREDKNFLPEQFENVTLTLVKDRYSNFSEDYIRSAVYNLFKTYFDNVKLGDAINIVELNSKLIQISGIKRISLSDGINTEDKLTFIVWNPLYEEDDFTVTQQNINVDNFTYHYFYDFSNFNSKINVINE